MSRKSTSETASLSTSDMLSILVQRGVGKKYDLARLDQEEIMRRFSELAPLPDETLLNGYRQSLEEGEAAKKYLRQARETSPKAFDYMSEE